MAMSEAQRTARDIAANQAMPWGEIDGSTVVITGATGLIGSQIVRTLIERTNNYHGSIKLVLPVRNVNKAEMMFGRSDSIDYLPWKIGDAFSDAAKGDYFVHAACPTSSTAFLHSPIEVISNIVDSAHAVIDLLSTSSFRQCVCLSTMEVYGSVEGRVNERMNGALDTMNPRSSYPEAKRLSECLFASASSELGVPISVVRLAQTFGVGVPRDDGRVFAEFGRSVVSGQDIVLLSDGSKRNSYLSVDDAVTAILFLLVHGNSGEAYNAANPATFCSILEMAQMVVEDFGLGKSTVVFGQDAERAKTFRPGAVLDLDCSRLMGLGWQPTQALHEMYSAMLAGWAEHE